jgi:hypothetical protein
MLRIYFRFQCTAYTTELAAGTARSRMTPSGHRRRDRHLGRCGTSEFHDGWLKTQFIRRDTARVEADTAALRAAGLPMG